MPSPRARGHWSRSSRYAGMALSAHTGENRCAIGSSARAAAAASSSVLMGISFTISVHQAGPRETPDVIGDVEGCRLVEHDTVNAVQQHCEDEARVTRGIARRDRAVVARANDF